MNDLTAIQEERRKLKWFMWFVIIILVLSGTIDFLFSLYGSPNIPKTRNPFMTVPYTPTPTAPLQMFAPSSPPTSPSGVTASKGPTLCTMDAKECPDGTFVGRTGPNCEFVACPKPGIRN